MGSKVCSEETKQKVDRDMDPEVIKRRTELFNKYVKPYFNMIYKLTMKYSFSPEHVEENYNEVLINFYRRIETYNPNMNLLTWLHICTKRQIIAFEKKNLKPTSKIDGDRNIEDFEEMVLDDDQVKASVMDIDNYRSMYNDDILSLLDEMKPLQRNALLLQEAGYSLKEIVEIEYQKGTLKSKNIETVKSRLFLARKFLKNNLNRDGERIYNTANEESI